MKVGEVGMKEYIVQAIEQETIDSFDAHNAPELIRCKDCKHGGMDTSSYPQYWCSAHGEYVKFNFFCGYGEKRD